MKRLRYRYDQFRKRLGPRVFMYFIMALVTALAAEFFGGLIPESVVKLIGGVNVNSILNSLTSTMLTISTFAVSTTVTANSNAVASTTPRVFKLILQDTRTQNMLVVFLGSFAFSATILILMPLGSFNGGGRVILFGVLVYILVNIILNFIRWTMSIRELGSMSHTIGKIENETLKTFRKYWPDPLSGCNHFTEDTQTRSKDFVPIFGYNGQVIQVIDENELNDIGKDLDVDILINVLEGDLITYNSPLAWVSKSVDAKGEERIRRAFLAASSRDVTVDGRFGIVMLQQTACKALSSAINDAGTAEACIQSNYRVLSYWPEFKEAPLRFPRVWKRSISLTDLMLEFYRPVVRDAGIATSVYLEAMASLVALSKRQVSNVHDAAKTNADICYCIAEENLHDESDLERVKKVYNDL